MRLLKCLVCTGLTLAILAGAHTAFAARAGNLFSAEVPVTEKSAAEKSRGASEALLKVLVKLTGDRRIGQNPAAVELLQKADDLVQQYRFTPNGTMLFGFDGRSLQKAMRQARLPVWGSDRPATLIWLAVDYGGGDRQILSADDRGEIRTQIEEVAAERGIPLVWPLNDSTDREQVTATDVWGGYSENVDHASARYGADAILVGRVSRSTNGNFFGNWHLQMQGEEQEWRGGLNSSVHRISDFYSERLASVANAGANSSVSMLISGLGDGRSYAQALSVVEKLGTVKRVQVLGAVGDTVQLEIELRGSPTQFRRSLGFSRVLAPEDIDSGSMFHYRFTR